MGFDIRKMTTRRQRACYQKGKPYQAAIELFCKAQGLPLPVAEYKFHKVRKWRFDFAFVEHKLALEVDGGAWTQGRHTRGKGFIADCIKLNEATILGWRVLRVTPTMIKNGKAFWFIERALNGVGD